MPDRLWYGLLGGRSRRVVVIRKTAVAAVLMVGSAVADDFPITNGRYQGKASVLRLTAAQVRALAATRDLTLRASQQATLRAATGVSPSRLHVYFTKDGENDHSCLAFNVALRFSDREIEVPINTSSAITKP